MALPFFHPWSTPTTSYDDPGLQSTPISSNQVHLWLQHNSPVQPAETAIPSDLLLDLEAGHDFESQRDINYPQPMPLREHDLTGFQGQTNQSFQEWKTTWAFLEQRIRRLGMKEVCEEMSEVGANLSKRAKETFIPISETEIQWLDLDGKVTHVIIRVETPLMSHLLGVPCGYYKIQEQEQDGRVLNSFHSQP